MTALSTGTLGADRECRPADEFRWSAIPSLLGADGPSGLRPTDYRLGEAVLHVATDDPESLVLLDRLYGECRVVAPGSFEGPSVRCVVRSVADPPRLLLTFQDGAPRDPAAVALALLHPPRGEPPYAIFGAPLPGWRAVGSATRPVVAASDAHVLVHRQRVPDDFLAEYLVAATLAAQPELLVVHAAALRLGAAAALLTGPSRAGKTTTSLHLAARGHPMLGDEMAVLRLRTGEVVPMRRSVSLRAGPRGPELTAALARLEDGPTGPRRIDELFPGSAVGLTRLGAAFVLGGFAERPSLTPFRLSLNDADVYEVLSANDVATVSWGLTPGRRTLRLLALTQMFARLPSWVLTVGPPTETAELIERTMEAQAC